MEQTSSSEELSEGLPSPAPLNPNASTSSGIRRSLFPPIWQRFQQHLQDPSKLPTATGAHVTLSDLEKLAELREAASSTYAPEPPEPSADGKISGWVGTPDPDKYVEGTNVLSPAEVEEEAAKGNIVMLDDWVKEISKLDLWKKRALFECVLKDWMQHRFFVQTENGSKVTFWDLYQYVHNNPELKALVESRRHGVAATGDPAEEQGPGGLYGDPGKGMWRDLDLDTAKRMPWGLAGVGQVWSRRPTRWLWGADALLDVNFAVYVHEDKAHEVLGAKYGHQDPRAVLQNEQYTQDILRAGPQMGMTFMITAARELPAQEISDAWTSRIAARLHRRALEQPVPASLPLTPREESGSSSSGGGSEGASGDKLEKSMQALFQVYCLMDTEQMAAETKIMDTGGRNFRKGSSLIISTGPEGKILLQATSPGLAREREGYLLGAVEDEELASALVEDFLGDDAVDTDFAASVPLNMLMFANGFKTDNTNEHPLMRRLDEGPGFHTEVIPAKATVFRLPRVGASQETADAAPLLLSGVRERALVGAVSDIYQRAYRAASDVAAQASGQTTGDLGAARREAARAVLQDGFSSLGLNLQGLGFDELLGEPEPFTPEELALLNRATAAEHKTSRSTPRRARLCVSGER